MAYGTQRTHEIQSPFHHGATLQTMAIQDRKVSDLILFPTRLSDLCWAESDLWWRATYDFTNTISSNRVYGISIESKDWSRRGYGITNDATPFAFPPGM